MSKSPEQKIMEFSQSKLLEKQKSTGETSLVADKKAIIFDMMIITNKYKLIYEKLHPNNRPF
jgi:hypothetical protein